MLPWCSAICFYFQCVSPRVERQGSARGVLCVVLKVPGYRPIVSPNFQLQFSVFSSPLAKIAPEGELLPDLVGNACSTVRVLFGRSRNKAVDGELWLSALVLFLGGRTIRSRNRLPKGPCYQGVRRFCVSGICARKSRWSALKCRPSLTNR